MEDIRAAAEAQRRPSVLFVGAEPALAEAFRAEYGAGENGWSVVLAGTAVEAMAWLEAQAFEAVVAEPDLPDGSGMDLLDEVMEGHPQPARILRATSMHSEMMLKDLGRAHHHLLDPCEPSTLMAMLRAAGALRTQLQDKELSQVVGRMHQLPSPPAMYFEVLAALQARDTTLERVGNLILQDPALSAKLLQLANSAVFGLQLRVIHPIEAIGYVGLETTKALLLLAHTFSFFKDMLRAPFSMESLGEHSLAVGRGAQGLAQQQGGAAELADQAFTAGLMHDLGKLFFAANLPVEFSAALRLAQAERIALHEAEQRIFGTTHAAVAGFVLGTWHLAEPIVQAVAWHHCPGQSPEGAAGLTPLAAVHVANYAAHYARPEQDGPGPSGIDMEYVERVGLKDGGLMAA